METKDLKRVLTTIHAEDVYDPVVSEEQKQWILNNALHAFRGFIRFYGQFNQDVQEYFWYNHGDDEPYVTRVTMKSTSDEPWGSLGLVPKVNHSGETRHLVQCRNSKTEFLSSELLDLNNWPGLMARGVPVRYMVSVVLTWKAAIDDCGEVVVYAKRLHEDFVKADKEKEEARREENKNVLSGLKGRLSNERSY